MGWLERKVGGVAPEKGGAAVEAEVDEGVGVGDGREERPVGDGGEGAVVGGAECRGVGPIVRGVGGAVHGEDDIDGTAGLEERGEGDVLQVFAAINEVEFLSIHRRIGGLIPTQKWVGDVLGNVVTVVGEVGQDADDEVGDEAGDAVDGADVLEEEYVE